MRRWCSSSARKRASRAGAASSVLTTMNAVPSSVSSRSTSLARGDEAGLHRLEEDEELGDVLQEARAEDAIGHLVERLRRHREQPRPVRHGEPLQQPAAEELAHPPGCIEQVERVARRRRVDDDQVVLARRVQVVQLLHRQVVVAVDEAAGDVAVQRIGQHRVAQLRRRVRGGGSVRPSRPSCRASPPTARHGTPRPASSNADGGTCTAVLPSGRRARARLPAGEPGRR